MCNLFYITNAAKSLYLYYIYEDESTNNYERKELLQDIQDTIFNVKTFF